MQKKSQQLIDAAIYKINNPTASFTSIAKQFKVDRQALRDTIPVYKKFNIDGHDGYHYYFEQWELDLVNYFLEHPNVSTTELKKIFNSTTSSSTLKRWLKILGKEYHTHYKYGYNRNAFSTIETEEDAYWLGFLTADGYLNETNGWVQLGLGEIDLEHLKKFLRYMGFTEEEITQNIRKGIGGAYNRDNIVYSAVICCHQIVNNLKQYGLFQGKSGKETPYICANKELQIAYIRGLIDGDGYIRSTQYGVGLVGSKEIVEFVRNFLGQELGWENYSEKYIHPHGKIYKFAAGGKNISKAIVHLLYDNSTIYLDRKFALYEQYCRG